MLGECAYSPRLPDLCLGSNWCCDPVPSPSIDGLTFLGSCGGSHRGAGITTGAGLFKAEDGARSVVSLVGVGLGSGMTNSDYTRTSLGGQGPGEIPEECCLEEGAVTGSMGHAANEGRQTLKAGTPTNLKRALQDRPEAPRRKRIHVCGSDFDAVGGRMGTHAGAVDSSLGARFTPTFYSSMQEIPADDGEEGIDKTSTNFQLERPFEAENSVMYEDVEMTEVIDESGEHELVDNSLPQVEGIPIEPANNDHELRASEDEDGDCLRPMNLTDMQVPGPAWQDGSLHQGLDGVSSGVFPLREINSSEDSARVMPPEAPGGIGVFPFSVVGTIQQIPDLLGPESGRVNEIHSDIGEGFLERRVDSRVNEEDLSKHVQLFSDEEPRSRNGYPPENVEVIEVDDSDDDDDDDPIELNVFESDGSSTKGTKPVTRPSVLRNGFRLSTSQSTSSSFSPDEESDSDDCQVVGEWKPNLNPRRQQRNKADSEGQDEDSDTEGDRSEESDSSDVQVAGGPQSEIQRGWEEAALRRRMGRTMKSAGSKVNGEREATADLDLAEGAKSDGLAESVATSAYRDSPDSTAESSEARGGAEGFVNLGDGHVGANLAPVSQGRLPETLIRNQEINPSDREGKDVGNHRLYMVNGGKSQSVMPSKVLNGHESYQEGPLSSIQTLTASESRRNSSIGASDGLDKADLIALREKLKQTPEFLQADEQEWASRQQELLRQQLEAQKMRQRRRVEADRKLEMERKQKLRIQELRQSQMKAEKDMDEKEQLRGQARERLEYLASRCTDLASLLRRLGINVDGGSCPTEQQVNAAFKRALVKFHPDRVVDGDARRMVEAEETFKLINRMKKTLDGYDPFR